MNRPYQPHIEMQIRTRGAVHTRGSVPVTRTRGGMRTRGAVVVETTPLTQLVAALRAKAHGSPSAIVIHGWEEASAQVFLDHIAPLLDSDDAIWLVPAETAPAPEAPPTWPGAVVLDLSHEVDARTYALLVVDAVFFPTDDLTAVRQWYGRTESVVLETTAEQATALLAGAPHNAPEVYVWSATEPAVLVRV